MLYTIDKQMINRATEVTVDELQAQLGEQVRRARVAAELMQAELAERANVSLSAVSSLEKGRAVNTHTLIAVVKALGLEDWLHNLSPEVTVSPLHMAATGNAAPRQRVRRPSNKRNS
ncbi:helix-turn-helix transcriptional regulator [Pelomonas sp. V22]|uniref:helix-turn-helix domain-containing protein n=1 Tax=Pelomonas sp. V22 TaxID=2822139 RepID=UPI0024A8A192|nr:helix-turn-helix transcriptional regulator [Pelomonas sp. V22]MDI4635858.1 helix-turn-helix transcriptional regulator [Pelomonas sp. V22]